jgi:hypothetical protein
MQKYIIVFLGILILALGGAMLWKNKQHQEELRKLNNALAASQQLVKETKTAVSSKALEIENLKTANADLQKVIKKNKEEIFAVANLALQWKNQYYNIKNATASVVDEAGTQPVSLPTECEECFAKTRIKVEFDHTADNLRIFGYTITNPTLAEINLEWLKPLQLELVLTKDDGGSFKIYLDEKDKESAQLIVPKELTLKVDPSVFNKKWYEKINLTANLAFGNSLIGTPTQFGGMASIGAGYMLTHNFSLGVNVSAVYAGNVYMFYGANVIWFPFARKQ